MTKQNENESQVDFELDMSCKVVERGGKTSSDIVFSAFFNENPGFAMIAEEACKLLADADATNYVELRVTHPEKGKFVILVQREDGLTPAMKNTALVKENEELKKKIEQLQNATICKRIVENYDRK